MGRGRWAFVGGSFVMLAYACASFEGEDQPAPPDAGSQNDAGIDAPAESSSNVDAGEVVMLETFDENTSCGTWFPAEGTSVEFRLGGVDGSVGYCRVCANGMSTDGGVAGAGHIFDTKGDGTYQLELDVRFEPGVGPVDYAILVAENGGTDSGQAMFGTVPTANDWTSGQATVSAANPQLFGAVSVSFPLGVDAGTKCFAIDNTRVVFRRRL